MPVTLVCNVAGDQLVGVGNLVLCVIVGLTYGAIYTICACIDATICRVSSRAVLVVERAEARRVRRVNFVAGLT